MDNTPIQMNGPVVAGRHAGTQPSEIGRHGKKKNKLKSIIIPAGAVLAVIILVTVGMFLYQSTTSANINDSKYQAVFLTNGQVYFGKLHTLNGGYMKLTDIYYLQTKADASSTKQATSDQNSSDVELIKLGSQEIHGPEDAMVINKDQVLFFENLKSDGKVSQAIAKYQTQK